MITINSMNIHSTTYIDLSYLHAVTGGDEAFEKTLLGSAISDIDVNIQRLRESWAQRDACQVRSAAHTLKSVVVIAGLPHLENACKLIDSRFRDGVFHEDCFPQMNHLINEWISARSKLKELLQYY